MKYVLSYGAGLNSTALLIYLLKNVKPLDLFLFSDTGDENPYTYDTVQYYRKLTQDKGIDFAIVWSSYRKSLFNYYWDKKLVPQRLKRDCTTKFKILPMRRYLRQRYGKNEIFTRYIGIDYGEAHRIKTNELKYELNSYPLVDAKIDRQGCIDLLKKENLPIPQKSGCWFCPFNRKQTWLDLLHDEPDKFELAIKFEQNHRHYPRPISLLSSKPLAEVRDKHRLQSTLEDFEHTCDVTGSCFL